MAIQKETIAEYTRMVVEVLVWVVFLSLLVWRYCMAPSHAQISKMMWANGIASDKTEAKNEPIRVTNVLRNGAFDEGLTAWDPWNESRQTTAGVRVVTSDGRTSVRIENPDGRLVGIQQVVLLRSGTVYRLSGSARSIATTKSSVIFGGRIGIYISPQPEKSCLWMSECTSWWSKTIVFTNLVSGNGVVFVSMGYGNVASTGDFDNISLERME